MMKLSGRGRGTERGNRRDNQRTIVATLDEELTVQCISVNDYH